MDAVGPRVLVIEPDALVGEAMLALLSGHYRIECVGSPAAALSMIRRGIYDALISEVQLPGMSVEQFWQHVHSIDPDLRLVLHTGSMPLVNGLPGPANGLGEFLRKPADSTSIRTAVARTVDATHAARRMASQLAEMDRLAAELEAARLERNLYAGILHDLNGPLTVISSLADTLMLEKNAGKVGSVDWDQSVQDLMAQANLCIDISRLSMGYARSRSAPDSCDVATVLADLDRLLHFHPACRGQTLVVHPFYLPVRVLADTTAVFRVILNLALNGLQSSRTPHRVEIFGWLLHEKVGGLGTTPANSEMLWLHDGFENRPPFVAICVRDSGPGIPLESLPGLFVRGTTNKPEGQGTGLGMGIVRQCLQMVGGAISVETQPGKGSSFVVYLPAAQRT